MKSSAYKRINVTLPASTIEMLESVAGRGERSGFIDDAIRTHVKNLKKQTLREQLAEGAIVNAERNLKMAEEWFHLEGDSWPDY